MILAQITLIAQLTFTSGNVVTLVRLPYGGPNQVYFGAASVVAKDTTNKIAGPLTQAQLVGWAGDAWMASMRDTVNATMRDLAPNPLLTSTLICTRTICRMNLIGAGYNLTPGQFPKSEMRTLARLLYLMAGWQPDSMVTIPFIWKQP